jgi:flagellar protein FliO/FliZ
MMNHFNNNKWIKTCVFVTLLTHASITFAIEKTNVSASGSMFKMVIGLGLVLAVMLGLAWLAKKFMPHTPGTTSIIKVVGGVSVGTRERVMVLEVADRWLVVGVAGGQISAIANIDPQVSNTQNKIENTLDNDVNNLFINNKNNFKQWFKQAMKK